MTVYGHALWLEGEEAELVRLVSLNLLAFVVKGFLRSAMVEGAKSIWWFRALWDLRCMNGSYDPALICRGHLIIGLT